MFQESIYGTYRLNLKEQMVYCEYFDGCNIAGVKSITDAILALTSELDSWVLYQKPDASAGIANDAIVTMMDGYVAFQNAGCKAVALVDNSIFVRAGIPYHPDELTMPIRIDKDEGLLFDWLMRKL